MEKSNDIINKKRKSTESDYIYHEEKRTRSDITVPAEDDTVTSNVDDGERYFGNDEISDECMKNFCTVCHVDMGEANPRQLCGKTRCLRQDEIDLTDENVTTAVTTVSDNNDGDEDSVETAAKDDANFPSLDDMSGAGVQAFSSLDTSTIYAIIEFDKRTEEFHDDQKDSLILTLRAQGSRKAIEVRATSVVQKTLLTKHKLEMLFTSHNFFIRYLGQKKSKRTGNTFCNFSIISRPK